MIRARTFAMRLTRLVTVVAGVAIAVVSAVHMTLEIREVRTHALESVGAQARVIAANSTAAIDFDDAEAARDTLRGLGAVQEFAAAEIVKIGPDGAERPFASYERDPGRRLPDFRGVREASIEGRWLRAVQPVMRDGEQIGELRIIYDFLPLQRRLLLELAFGVGMALLTLALAFLAARRIQRALLRPVRELAHAAETIASTDDFSVRAKKVSDDELGTLTNVFNSMIARIAEAEALRRNHRQLLEEEVSRRTAEVLEAQARLRQSERMASLGTLSAGLGHDIGNILMPLRSHLDSIKDRLGHDAGAEHDFAAIARATDYLQNLSASLRLFAQEPAGDDPRHAPTPLVAWWARMEPLLRSMIGSRIVLEHDIPAGLPPVKLTQSLLMQAVFNLVQNAAQALAPEGRPPGRGARVRVEARRAVGDDGRAMVAVSVVDNGPGMTEEVMKRCCEPYFTTKTRGISSGLGLSLVKGIAEAAGGALEVRSAPGEGSTFTLVLPAHVSPAPDGRTLAVVTLTDPRRSAVVSHLLRSLRCEVRTGEPSPAETNGGSPGAIWVCDSLDAVPASWEGSVVLMSDSPAATDARAAAVLDPATPLPRLRDEFRRIMPGAAR